MSEQRKGRLMLSILLAVFILPVMIGLYLYATDRRMGGKSHGELLQPPRKLAFGASQEWQGKWRLVYVSGKACAEDCRNKLYMMRQVHVSLDKDIDRLRRVWVVDGAVSLDELGPLRQRYPDLLVLNEAGDTARQFDLPDVPAGTSGRIYLVDPLGNLIMSYPRGADPNGMRKDLTRLLTYSWTG